MTPPVRRLFWAVLIRCFSRGLTLSLYVLYLHNVRHFTTNFSTEMLAVSAVAGLASGWFWGHLVDRWAPTPVLVLANVSDAGAVLYWAFVHSAGQAIIGSVLLGVLTNNDWGAASTLLTRLMPEEQRQRAFGFNFMLVNLGIGAGGLVSALVVNLQRPATFTDLYIGNAIVTVLSAVPVLSLWRSARVDRDHPDHAHLRHEGYREVFTDRRLLTLMVASALIMIGGYGSQEAGFSLFVVNNLHLSVHTIGLIFFFNTATIIVAQMFVINRVQGRSRTYVMAFAAVLWAVFWFVLAGSLVLSAVVAVVALSAAMMIFAIGETVLNPSSQAIVAEIAPDHLRGRYNAALGTIWGVVGFIAPLLTGLYFSAHVGNWWPAGTGVVALAGAAATLRLRHQLTPAEDGRAVAS